VLDFTHAIDRSSWVGSATATDTEFPLQNLPLGVFGRPGGAGNRIGVAIGDEVFDLAASHAQGLLEGVPAATADTLRGSTLNAFMALEPESWRTLRHRISRLLGPEASPREREAVTRCLLRRDEVEQHLPVAVGDYTDFYASIHHATNVGRLMRPDNPLLPNYKWVPIAYHGRASSVVVSGTPVVRPKGQIKRESDAAPMFAVSRRLDYELELGAYIGGANPLGSPVPIERADQRLFGLCLVNDWSARDIQAWEYQPLGPFLAKSFATSVSPWIVTRDALEPFRVALDARPGGDPGPLPHLDSAEDQSRGGFDLSLEAWLSSAAMRAARLAPVRITVSRARHLYWTFGQMIAHHTSNGCNLRPGDLLASGTVSGPSPDARACLLERAGSGTEALTLPSGETRTFLEDGDEITLRGRAERAGSATIGFGECRGRVITPS
jgi:fumarylacetoacetase